MNDQVTDLIIQGDLPEAFRRLRTQFAHWKKVSPRFLEEQKRCHKLAARHQMNLRQHNDGMTDPDRVSREANRIVDGLIDLNGGLPDEFWADAETIAATLTTEPAGPAVNPPPPEPEELPAFEAGDTGGQFVPPGPQQQAQHDPSHLFGRWHLVRVIQNNHIMPLNVAEVATYERDFSFQLSQNGLPAAWGKFSYSGIDLAINLANGFVDRRKFTCYGNSLLLFHEGNGVYSFYQRLT